MIGARIIAARDSDAPASLLVPFEPKHFTDAFSDVARETELGAFTRGVLFERCAEVLGDSLGTLYRELDTVLDNAGVPKQDMATAMRVVHGVAREGSASIDAAQVERVLESDDAGQSLSATALQRHPWRSIRSDCKSCSMKSASFASDRRPNSSVGWQRRSRAIAASIPGSNGSAAQ